MIAINAASSHQKSNPDSNPKVVATEATNATVIAIAINNIIPGRRRRTSSTPPAKNGHPPYQKTTVPNTGASHREPANTGAA